MKRSGRFFASTGLALAVTSAAHAAAITWDAATDTISGNHSKVQVFFNDQRNTTDDRVTSDGDGLPNKVSKTLFTQYFAQLV